jgi:hypothetical protein
VVRIIGTKRSGREFGDEGVIRKQAIDFNNVRANEGRINN